MRRFTFLIVIFLFAFTQVFGQNNSLCGGAAPLCSGSAAQYPASTNGAPATGAASWGCLGSVPNPAWFTLPISQTGVVTVVMQAQSDIDFIAWGPFSSPIGNCGNTLLNPSTQVPNSPNNFSSPTNTSQGCSYSGSATETLIIPNAQAGEYYVLLITNYSNQQMPITVTPQGGSGSGSIGNMDVAASFSVCAGQSPTAQVLPGSSVQSIIWYGPSGAIGSNYSPTFAPIYTTTTYTVVGTAAAGQTCAISKQVIAVQNPTPMPINDGPVCEYGSVQFSEPQGMASYTWAGPNGFSANGANPILSGALLNHTGIYTVYSTSSTCVGSGTTYLQVKPNPTLSITKGGDFCFGKNFNLTVNGAYTYTWTGPNAYLFNGSNPVFVNSTNNMTGMYSVTGEMNGCKSTTGISVLIRQLPNVQASSTGEVCENSSFSLTASGATTYTWTGPVWTGASFFSSNQAIVGVNPAMPYMQGTYYLTGKDTNGCVNYDTLYQFVHPAPLPVVVNGGACVGEALSLSASGGDNYYWTGPNSFSSHEKTPVIFPANFANSGTYNVKVTSAYGCTASAVALGTIYALPDVRVGGAIELCEGQTFTFTGQGANQYRWLASFGEILKGSQFVISTLAPDLQANYTLIGIDNHACTNSTIFYPIVNRLPKAEVNLQKKGACAPFCAELALKKLSPNIQAEVWRFNDKTLFSNPGTFKKCIKTAGVYPYNVHLTDSAGCVNIIYDTLYAYPSPEADFSYTPDAPNENKNKLTFADESKNANVVKWNWDFYVNASSQAIDSSDIRFMKNPVRVYPEVGMYLVYLTVTSDKGCKDSVAKFITIAEDYTFFIPDVFTPNDDGVNDVFMPKAVAVSSYQMQIFNRWGNLLYSTDDITKGWEGKTQNGDFYPVGEYVYKFTVSDADKNVKEYKGRFTLLR